MRPKKYLYQLAVRHLRKIEDDLHRFGVPRTAATDDFVLRAGSIATNVAGDHVAHVAHVPEYARTPQKQPPDSTAVCGLPAALGTRISRLIIPQ